MAPRMDDLVSELDRRAFLRGVLGAGLFVPRGEQEKEEEEEVSPPEDLMREHGILKRVLLVYEEAIRRIDTNQDLAS